VAKKPPTVEEAPADPFQPRYPAIEALVQSEDFKDLNKNYEAAYNELEKVAKQKGMGKTSEAKKAMKALERVSDLLNYLLKLKLEFLQAQGEQAGDKKTGDEISGDTQLHGTTVR